MNSLKINTETTQIQSNFNNENTKSPIPEVLKRIQELIKNKTSYDSFGNCNIDLASINEFSEKINARAVKHLLPLIIENEKNNNKHVLTMKLATSQYRLYKYVLNAGMKIHHADNESAWITMCLKAHKIETCTYPKYKTVSVGISAVIFNGDLSKFLAVKEIVGPYRGWKAPTGTVDYETGENPLEAAVREISEETNLKLDAKHAILVGNAWTKNFRGKNPDINYVFAFQTDQQQELHAQEEEISKVEWISVKNFLDTPAQVSNEATFILKGVVSAALKAIQDHKAWKAKDQHWGSGKEVTLFNSL